LPWDALFDLGFRGSAHHSSVRNTSEQS
jgi:hypothetical protein